MSAIVSLLRVMTLRDAEAMTLEAGKIPNLRRRGQVEALAMPPLDPKLLDDFVAPLIAGKSLDLEIDDHELAATVAALGTHSDGGGISADLGLELDGVRVRVNAFDHFQGHAIAARLIRDHVPGLGELALPTELASIVELRDG